MIKEKFLLFLAACLILIILIPHCQLPKPVASPSQFFGQLLENLEPEKPVTLIAVGDIMLGRSVNAKMRKLNDFHYPFLKTADFLKSADLTFANLESPFYDGCPTTNTGMIFCADSRAIEGLVFAGIDVVNLANNHLRNYGETGMKKTVELLNKNNVSIIGLNDNLVQKEIRGTKFGFLGFDLTSGYQEEKMIKTVQENSLRVDVLIVSFHWGAEYAKEPTEKQVELAHKTIDAGAALILGHHPHVIQRVEDYHGAKIVYSLGNFIFDQPWSEATKRGLVGIFTFQGKKLINSEFKEVYIKDYSQPEFTTR